MLKKDLFAKYDFIDYCINFTICRTPFRPRHYPLHFKHLFFDASFYQSSLKDHCENGTTTGKKHLRIKISSITMIGDSVININK
jgi:hypothetical protein